MRGWVKFLNLVKEGYKAKRDIAVKIPYSSFSLKLGKLFLNRGFIQGLTVKRYYNKKKKKYLLGIFVKLKYYRSKAILRDIEIVPFTFFGMRETRKALSFSKIMKLGQLDTWVFHTEKGFMFGGEIIRYRIGGFPVCRIVF